MRGELGSGAAEGRIRRRPIHCEECTIQIGDGYQESVPFEFVDDESAPCPRVLKVCWRCWESLTRRRAKRLSEVDQQHPGVVR
jgi:hypothetical protein